MKYVVRCRYIASVGRPEGVGYLDFLSMCSSRSRDAKLFDNESDAWLFASNSGERVPDDCWVEPAVDT